MACSRMKYTFYLLIAYFKATLKSNCHKVALYLDCCEHETLLMRIEVNQLYCSFCLSQVHFHRYTGFWEFVT